ncbi:hypothetical protein DYB28_002937 [Aphanomyces astaci]|uniref:SCP domain-containing protein n=1 Tax=Aphanomyces astaci TaxID=112090 RepID=A0A397EXX4_APHAT|nr:hypothetical protein DYB31_005978 [Aphanomyces astaci]RLO12611.1 hypothetical protein DYB28_002937 [Aphanomyces astaci]
MWSTTLLSATILAVLALMPSSVTSASVCAIVEAGVDYYGNDLVATFHDNHADCCSDCQSTDRCVVYTWRDGVCYLKHTKGTPEYVPGVTSAALPAQPGGSRTCGKVERDVDYPGNDIARTNTANAADCCTQCAANNACVVSVWYNGACYLKDNDRNKIKVAGARAYHVQTDGNTPKPTTPPSSSTVKPQPTPPPSGKGDLAAQVTYQLSIIRQAHGLNAVEYDADMATGMQAWADDCSQHPNGGHGGPYGVQNLAPALICGDNCMTQDGPSWWWYDEIKDWDFNTNKCNVGNEACGHFENSMGTWVTHVGCGWSSCFNPSIGKIDPLLWCNYRGNGDDHPIPPPLVPQDQIKASLTAAFKRR